eukprot:TRINITY_DN4443_c0_g1_i1.p1 TRINITY_DN4443_c0_g1~~TRINITY_DN4443_c0_g1_i1.p1  ORF type:complete len:554 (-),score=182.14 TRINITY_DN4443_c0_g1_i1:15-1676(-)
MEEHRGDARQREADLDARILELQRRREELAEQIQVFQKQFVHEKETEAKANAIIRECKRRANRSTRLSNAGVSPQQAPQQAPAAPATAAPLTLRSKARATFSTSPPPSTSNSPPNNRFFPNGTETPNKTFINAKILFNGKSFTFALDPGLTVEENVNRFAKTELADLPLDATILSDCGFFVPLPVGIWLTKNQKISRFALKEGVELEFKSKNGKIPTANTTKTDSVRLQKEDEIYLKIQVPEDQDVQSKTFKFNIQTTTVQDVINQLLKKYKVDNVEDFGLVKLDSSAQQTWLDETQKISFYGLKNNQVLLFQQKPDDTIFKVFPSMLPLSEDSNGYVVPTALIDLKRCLLDNDGLRHENIFRVAGDEPLMRRLRKRLTLKQHISVEEPIQVYSVAALIKQWFKELPQKLLQPIKAEDLRNCRSEEDAVRLAENLPSLSLALLNWLVELLAETSAGFVDNLMTVQDLGVLFAPTLYNTSQMENNAALQTTQDVASLLCYLISRKKGQEFAPHFSNASREQMKSDLRLDAKRLLDLLWEEEEEERQEQEEDFDY